MRRVRKFTIYLYNDLETQVKETLTLPLYLLTRPRTPSLLQPLSLTSNYSTNHAPYHPISFTTSYISMDPGVICGQPSPMLHHVARECQRLLQRCRRMAGTIPIPLSGRNQSSIPRQ